MTRPADDLLRRVVTVAATVGVVAATPGSAETRAAVVAVVGLPPGAVLRLALAGGELVEVGGGGVRLPLADGTTETADASCDDAVVWPGRLRLAPGVRAVVHVEPHRRVVVEGTDGAPVTDLLAASLVPDRTTVPTGPSARVDALQTFVDLYAPAVERTGDGVVLRAPRVAWWVFLRTRRGPVVAHLGAEDDVLRLRPPRRRVVDPLPALRGRPAPPGTLVAPGRLDLAACASVRELLETGTFDGAQVVGGTSAAHAVVADSRCVTMAHPSFGVAHAPWDGDRLAEPVLVPGAVAFVRRGGGRLRGTVCAWPAWPGGGAFSRPSDRFLRALAVGADRVVVRGLPFGEVRYDGSAAAGAPLTLRGRVLLSSERPRAVVPLDVPP